MRAIGLELYQQQIIGFELPTDVTKLEYKSEIWLEKWQIAICNR